MRVIGGRYELAERIGGGGMADVFRAHDPTLGRDVAVKIMRPAFAGVPEFVERFHREAEALGAIDHPNIVRVLDYGAGADGPFIVMELVDGGTLRDFVRARRRVGQFEAARIAAEIADGLEAAHVRGVLHRDLKPDNILLDRERRPKIADFGIARLAAATAITSAGELLGSPHYLAPEQMTGDVVDERADVYALGVILYEMLTGARVTGGTTPSEIVSRRLRVDPRPPSRLVPLDPAMNALVLRALARDPARRIHRAADLRDALLGIKPSEPRARSAWPLVGLRMPSPAPLLAALGLLAASAIRPPSLPPLPAVRLRLPSLSPLIGGLAAFSTTARTRVAEVRRRSLAPVLAALALLLAFVGATLAFAGPRPAAVAPQPVATGTPAPTSAILSSTSTPAVSARPTPTAEPTVEPTPEPTPEPTLAPVVATVSGDPAGTIVAFYELISGHDYVSASGLWSDRMRASYPPQTNIWGRFDRTSSIVARSAALTSASPASAAVAVDLIETLRDGSVRHWVGTWYLVPSGSGWLLDQPGLRGG